MRWHTIVRTSQRSSSGPRTWLQGVLVGSVTADTKPEALALAVRDPQNKEVRTEVIAYPEWAALSPEARQAVLAGSFPRPPKEDR